MNQVTDLLAFLDEKQQKEIKVLYMSVGGTTNRDILII